MEGLDSILERYKKSKDTNKPPSHQRAASVNEIIKVLGENKTYSYSYWLNKVGSASYTQVLDILKKAEGLERKYSKGGFVTNQLKPYAITRPRTARTNRPGTRSVKGSGQRMDKNSIPKVDDAKGSVDVQS